MKHSSEDFGLKKFEFLYFARISAFKFKAAIPKALARLLPKHRAHHNLTSNSPGTDER